MATLQVIGLNQATPQLTAAQNGVDDYTMPGALTITGTLDVRSSASNPLEVRNAGGTLLGYVDSAGRFNPYIYPIKGASWGSSTALAVPLPDITVLAVNGFSIVTWTILGDAVGSCEIDVRKCPAGLISYPATAGDSIVNSNYPSVVSAYGAEGFTTGWLTNSFLNSDYIAFHVNSVSGFTQLSIQLLIVPNL